MNKIGISQCLVIISLFIVTKRAMKLFLMYIMLDLELAAYIT
jgi:hypothetical protein